MSHHVNTSLLSDFVQDKRLLNLFQSELGMQLGQRERLQREQRLISEEMISEQLQRIVKVHRNAMEKLEMEEKECKDMESEMMEKGG
jgi:hypothetical protein